jgi:hypothetical protein
LRALPDCSFTVTGARAEKAAFHQSAAARTGAGNIEKTADIVIKADNILKVNLAFTLVSFYWYLRGFLESDGLSIDGERQKPPDGYKRSNDNQHSHPPPPPSSSTHGIQTAVF